MWQVIQGKPLMAVRIYIYIGNDDHDDPGDSGETAHRRVHLYLNR